MNVDGPVPGRRVPFAECTRALIALLLLVALVFPTALQVPKSGVLLLALVSASLAILVRALLLAKPIAMACLFYAFVGLYWSTYGAMNGNPGAIRVMTVMVAYPLLFIPLIAAYERGDDSRLFRLFFLAAWLIVALDFWFIFGSIYYPGNSVESFLKWLHGDWAVVDNGKDYLRFTLPNLTSVIFLAPFFFVGAIVSDGGWRRLWLLVLVTSLFALALLSGRRALLVTMFAGPLVAFLLTFSFRSAQLRLDAAKLSNLSIFVAAIVGALVFSYWYYPDYYERLFASILDFERDQSNLERAYQYESLINGLGESPFVGEGAGAAADYIRSAEMPWAYELFYVAMAYQYGIVGLTIYAIGVLVLLTHLVLTARDKGRRSFEFLYLSAMLSFLLANATNPYLAKFDYMWVIFVPVAMMNAWVIARQRERFAAVAKEAP